MKKGEWMWVNCRECGGKGAYINESGFDDCGGCSGTGRFFVKIKEDKKELKDSTK